MGLIGEDDFWPGVGGRHTAGTCLNPISPLPAHVQSHEEDGDVQKWQEQEDCPSAVGEGWWGRFAGFPPLPRSLSDLDLQMFYYADASCGRVSYCSISGHPRQGAGGRHAGTHPDSLLWEFIHKTARSWLSARLCW